MHKLVLKDDELYCPDCETFVEQDDNAEIAYGMSYHRHMNCPSVPLSTT